MHSLLRAAILLVLLLSAAPAAAQADDARLAAEGRVLLERQCGRCHQVGASGPSAQAEAAPFRDMMQAYPPEALEEALGEGLATSHPDMPEFVFEPDEVAAIVAYLATLRAAH